VCFSENADIVAGALLTPIGIASLREVRCWREVPFASLPMLFALHQFTEAFVWSASMGGVSHHVGRIAAIVYVAYALPVLPTLLPVSVLLLEPRKVRLRVAPFVVIGLIVSSYLAIAMIRNPITVTAHAHSLEYGVGLSYGYVWAVFYVIAVVGPSILSGYRSIVAFGTFNLVGLVVVAIIYIDAFASFWCILAGISSVLVLLHMIRRRKLPDADRIHAIRTHLPHLPHQAHQAHG
jgi:hypothetical protein